MTEKLSLSDKIKNYEAKQSLLGKPILKFRVDSENQRVYVKCLDMSITECTIPSFVTDIEVRGFYRCTELKTVALYDNIQTIGNLAFSNCTKLEKVIGGQHIKHIGNGAFGYCHKLHHIDLGESLENIGSGAFAECVELKELEIPNNVKSIGSECFLSTGLNSLKIDCALDELEDRILLWNHSLTDLIIKGHIKKIGEYVFSNCAIMENLYVESTEEVEIPVNSIMINCRELKTLTLNCRIKLGSTSIKSILANAQLKGDITIKTMKENKEIMEEVKNLDNVHVEYIQ